MTSLKVVPIKLAKEEDKKLYADFQDAVKLNASDVTKTTKMLWRDYVERNTDGRLENHN